MCLQSFNYVPPWRLNGFTGLLPNNTATDTTWGAERSNNEAEEMHIRGKGARRVCVQPP